MKFEYRGYEFELVDRLFGLSPVQPPRWPWEKTIKIDKAFWEKLPPHLRSAVLDHEVEEMELVKKKLSREEAHKILVEKEPKEVRKEIMHLWGKILKERTTHSGERVSSNPKVDWRWLLENWDKLTDPEKERIRTLLRETPTEKALELLKKHPELKRLYELAGITPPKVIPVKPKVVPPPKILPEIPETCPICGTPIKQVEKIPLRVKDHRLLTAEEEYLRARLGLPIPTEKIEMIDVPPTMKIWACKEDHIYERDAYGRLIQRTPEYIYKKILREKAKLEKIFYPPLPPPKKQIQADFTLWLRMHGITVEEFAKMPPDERRELINRWLREKGLRS